MPRKCVFCGSSGRMSKEHFWPRWFGKLLVKKGIPAYVSESFVGVGKEAPNKKFSENERQGDLTTMKFRVVCRSCNGGWMSLLEQKVKPIILAVINGNRFVTNGEANIIATWATMKVMVAEFAETKTVLTPEKDRKRFSESLVIPDYYSVYMGCHNTEAHAGYLRHSSTLSTTLEGPSPHIPRECDRNCQIVSFLLGPMVLHVVGMRVDGVVVRELSPEHSVVKIWPPDGKVVDFEFLPEMGSQELYALSHWMEGVLKNPRVKFGGDFRRGTKSKT